MSREAGIGDLSLIKKIWRDKKVFCFTCSLSADYKAGKQ
ncbi:hypothetical protein NEOC65_000890 [Neochlamydia sp. AcF65]|nr:hypothetical protein [Neochlamydia sp. AcF65]MBS4171566.1 hypothetical protein [Neochlamydia sp. AcF95]